RLDRVLQRAQVQPFYISPEQARRMIRTDQTIQIDRSQLNLISHRLAQSRAPRHAVLRPSTLLRQVPQQFISCHPGLHSIRHPGIIIEPDLQPNSSETFTASEAAALLRGPRRMNGPRWCGMRGQGRGRRPSRLPGQEAGERLRVKEQRVERVRS